MQLEERVKKLATKTHKDRVHEFNSKLEALSEHHDIPKVSKALLVRLASLLISSSSRSDLAKTPRGHSPPPAWLWFSGEFCFLFLVLHCRRLLWKFCEQDDLFCNYGVPGGVIVLYLFIRLEIDGKMSY